MHEGNPAPTHSTAQAPADANRPPQSGAESGRPPPAPTAGPSRTQRGGHAKMHPHPKRHGVDPVRAILSGYGSRLRAAIQGQPFHFGVCPIEHGDAHVDTRPPHAGLGPISESPPTVQIQLDFSRPVPGYGQGDGVEFDAQFIGPLDPLFQSGLSVSGDRIEAVV